MDADTNRQVRVRMVLIFLFSLFFLLFSFRKKVDSPEEIKRNLYGETQIELIQEKNNSSPIIKVHFFKSQEEDPIPEEFGI